MADEPRERDPADGAPPPSISDPGWGAPPPPPPSPSEPGWAAPPPPPPDAGWGAPPPGPDPRGFEPYPPGPFEPPYASPPPDGGYGAYQPPGPPPPGGWSPDPYGSGGYGYGQYGYGGPAPYGAPRTEGTAVWALVVSILGLFVCGIVLGIVGLVLSQQALTKIDQSYGQLGGRGLAVAARVISIVAIVGGALTMLWFFANA